MVVTVTNCDIVPYVYPEDSDLVSMSDSMAKQLRAQFEILDKCKSK